MPESLRDKMDAEWWSKVIQQALAQALGTGLIVSVGFLSLRFAGFFGGVDWGQVAKLLVASPATVLTFGLAAYLAADLVASIRKWLA